MSIKMRLADASASIYPLLALRAYVTERPFCHSRCRLSFTLTV